MFRFNSNAFETFDLVWLAMLRSPAPSSGIPLPDKRKLELILDKLQKCGFLICFVSFSNGYLLNLFPL